MSGDQPRYLTELEIKNKRLRCDVSDLTSDTWITRGARPGEPELLAPPAEYRPSS